MKERLVTLVCALGALGLFCAMILRTPGGPGGAADIPRPTSAETRGNGYYAAASWLNAERLRVVSLRDRFVSLAARRDLAPSGNLLIVTLPAASGFATEEFVPLDRWVRAGNTLLVVAALADDPDWALRGAGLAPSDVNLLTGLSFETLRARAQHEAPTVRRTEPAPESALQAGLTMLREPQRSTLLPNREHAYFHGVRTAVALSDYAHQSWVLKVPYEGFALELAHDRDTGAGVLWTRPLGSGRIIVSGFGSLFTNRVLGLADNAALLANIVATNVGAGGAVLFDDAHQGLGAAYDPEKFYRDRRLYQTLGILLALWLAWVLGATRLRGPAARQPAPREADLVRATGGFLARVLRSDAAARRMFERFLARTPAHSAAQAWRYLERQPRVAAADLRQLQGWYTRAYAGERVPLRRLHNVMVRTARQLQ
jgi:hypothetical protein